MVIFKLFIPRKKKMYIVSFVVAYLNASEKIKTTKIKTFLKLH